MFDFYTAGRIRFGWGASRDLPSLLSPLGRRFFVAADGRIGAHRDWIERWRTAAPDVAFVAFLGVDREPTPELIDAAAQAARDAGCDAVLGLGGGSAMDVGKAVAGLMPSGGRVEEYLEGVGTGRKVTATVPYVAVPTTSGTGAEVTKNAVVSSKEKGYKKSFRDERLLARLVVVDPELTVTLPPAQTAASGMDALTQLIESYLTRKHTPLTDALALHGMSLAVRALPVAYEDGACEWARTDMAAASLMSGIALANAGLGAVHGIAASLGAHLGLGHGLACAVLLPHVLARNAPHCQARMRDIERALGGDAVEVTARLNARMGIPGDLKPFGIDRGMLMTLARDSAGSSMSGNPVQLDDEGWADFLADLI